MRRRDEEHAFRGWPDCDLCGEPVKDPRDAALSLDTAAAWRKIAESNGWREAKVAEKRRGGLLDRVCGRPAIISWDAAELLEDSGRPPEPWVWTHNRCIPDRRDYRISGDRPDKLGKALDGTPHLVGKA